MYSKVQLLALYNSTMEEEIPLPLENEDGALQLNDVKVCKMSKIYKSMFNTD